MNFEDFAEMDRHNKVMFVKKYLGEHYFDNPNSHIGACLSLLDYFESGEFSKNESDNECIVTAKLKCDNTIFNQEMKETQNIIDEATDALEKFNKEIDKLNAKLANDNFISGDKLIGKMSERWH